MRDGIRAEIAARVFLTLGALLPYWRLLTFGVIYVTDDYFASDIFNGELPGRVLVGQLIRHGQWPVWTNQLCSGLPLAGAPADPIGLASFVLLPPAAALDLFVIVLLLVAAHGAYSLARRIGADRPGAVLAGLAFAGSGYIACQLKHLGIVSTVVWLPVGLTLDRSRARRPHADEWRAAGVVHGGVRPRLRAADAGRLSAVGVHLRPGLRLVRAVPRRGRSREPRTLARVAGTTQRARRGDGTGCGRWRCRPPAAVRARKRVGPGGDTWLGMVDAPSYWVPNLLTFLVPYINGDISNNTYIGPRFFWEDYGYVGMAPFLLAFYGGAREWRRPVVAFAIVMTIVAYLFVLGAATPVFKVAYTLVPGMSMFRFPTRFLIVVELGIALLGAIGLTRLAVELKERWPDSVRVRLIVLAAVRCHGCRFVHPPAAPEPDGPGG